jgi:O-antigen ligase
MDAPRVDTLWIGAALAMICLAGCTYFLPVEGALAVAVALLILLFALADLRLAFLAFVAIYPFLSSTWGVDVSEWMPYLTAKRLCCLVLSLTFAVHGRGVWDTPRMRRIGGFLLGLIVVQTIAGFGSHDPLGAVKRTFGDAVEWYLPFFIGSHLFRTKAQVRLLLNVVFVSMGIVAILAVIEHLNDYNFYESFVAPRADIQALLTQSTELYRLGSSARRVRVAFNHPIELGLHLMCVLLVAVYLIRQRGLVRKIALLGFMPVFILALLDTYSRGPMLGLAAGILWLAVVGRGTRSLLPLMLLCGLGAFLLMPTQARGVLEDTISTSTDIQTGDSIGGGTVRARLNLLQAGLQFSQQNIWFGIGPGEVKQRKVSSGRGEVVDFSSVDNFYLQVLLRHGAIVLMLTVGFYLYLLIMLTRAALRTADRDMSLLITVAAAMCLANYIALVTVGINITLFWILLGPAVRGSELSPGEVPHPGRRQRGRSMGNRLSGGGLRHGAGIAPYPASARGAGKVAVPNEVVGAAAGVTAEGQPTPCAPLDA